MSRKYEGKTKFIWVQSGIMLRRLLTMVYIVSSYRDVPV